MAGPLNEKPATVRLCSEPNCVRPAGHSGEHIAHTCEGVNTLLAIKEMDAFTQGLINESVTYAEGVLDDVVTPAHGALRDTVMAAGPYATETWQVREAWEVEHVELAITRDMEWLRARLAQAWVMGYAAAMDDLSERKASKMRGRK
jgi:hypothetical protein